MKRPPVVFLVYPPDNEPCKIFAQALQESLTGWQASACEAKVKTLLLDSRKADLLHFLLPPGNKLLPLAKKIAAGKRSIHTVVASPRKNQKYSEILCAARAVVFTQAEKTEVERTAPGTSVSVIAPCKSFPSENSLQPAAHLRERHQVGDRLLVVALTDITNRPVFDAFLYISREYNRRGGFRFLIPRYDHGKETNLWRGRLQETIRQEKLDAVTILEESDIQLFLPGADFALHLERETNSKFGFSLPAIDFLLLGKPVFCFNQPALNEVIYKFQPRWVANNIEDVIRASRDLRKDQSSLPQIAVDLARYAKEIFSPENVASRYHEIYHQVSGAFNYEL
ncbi:hypothetical protein L0156_25810 [bacterium]|nr:hypothetical protein [bacterium]